MEFIVYRYLNEEGEIIYVGKTLRPLQQRVSEHKVEQLWKETHSIEYIECDNEADMNCHERYYINFYKPKFNIQDLRNGVPKMTPYPYEWKLYWKASIQSTSQDINNIEKLFILLNKEYFQNKLPMQMISITKTKPRDGFGFVDERKIYENSGKYSYCIEIPDEYLYNDFEKAIIQLIVCMIDIYYSSIENIKTSSRNGRYRSSRFKKIGIEKGLIFSNNIDKVAGWVPIGINNNVKDICEEVEINTVSIYKKSEVLSNGEKFVKGTAAKRTNSFKWVCPCCKTIVRSGKPKVNIVCGECNIPFAYNLQ